MGLKAVPASLHWSHPSVPHSPSSSQTLASAISSPSSKRRSFTAGDGALFCRYVERSGLLLCPNQSSRLYWSRSCGNNQSRARNIRRTVTASFDSFSDEELSKQIQELALRVHLTCDELESENGDAASNCEAKFMENRKLFDILEPPDFPERDEIIPANMEMKANSVGIPLSLRMIRKKKQWEEGFIEAGETACCSVKKAFSSMVFIIRELHSYTLQMREILFYEDLQGILANVHKEMHASFVWLFQKVFAQTPTLMVYVMILLANYSVYSISSNAALAASPSLQQYPFTTEEVSAVEDHSPSKFDSSNVKTLKLPSSSTSGKTTSVGGGGGGGGKSRLVASGTDGDGTFDESNYYYHTNDGESSVLNPSRSSGEESVSMQDSVEEEEANLWNSIEEEASKMQGESREEAMFISPVDATLSDDVGNKTIITELLYETRLAQEPNNALLLTNYAQFLFMAEDFDRAEEFFKRATEMEPKDAMALKKYADFLWKGRGDLWAAEEAYLEAISADPNNPFYPCDYAHFLWSTGAQDTCFPLSSPETTSDGV